MKVGTAGLEHRLLISPTCNFSVFRVFGLTFVRLVPAQMYQGQSDFGAKPGQSRNSTGIKLI